MNDFEIQRHKTAIRRNKLSRPVTLLVEKGLVTYETKFFDYGCGHGQDLEILEKNGFTKIGGHDPYYRADAPIFEAEVVNLGYVINVIEKPQERDKVLKKAFELARKVLCVSAMLKRQKSYKGEVFSDGVKTKVGTFQKYYDQIELKNYLESVLGEEGIVLCQGVFLVFKREKDKIEYLEKQYRRNIHLEVTRVDPVTQSRVKVRVFRPKLEEFLQDSPFFKNVLGFVLEHGRLPTSEESSDYRNIIEEVKSKRKLANFIIENIDPCELNHVRTRRSNDLLVMFALRRFSLGKFPPLKDIPVSTFFDIKDFFGSYKQFSSDAEALLFSLGNSSAMGKALNNISIGKILPDAVYVHPSYLKDLSPPVRIKVGIAKALVGDIDECNLIKINKTKDKISFLVYEDFDEVEHPALLYSYVVDIPKAKIKEWDFTTRENPPILHRKETFVAPDYPMYKQFKKLSEEEEALGLLGHNNIGTMLKWEKFLISKGLVVAKHRVKDLTSYMSQKRP